MRERVCLYFYISDQVSFVYAILGGAYQKMREMQAVLFLLFPYN